MTKHDWIWVAIRIFGIFLLVQAIMAIPSLISSALFLHTAQWSVNSGSGQWDDVERLGHRAIMKELSDALVRLLFFGSIGVYFIKGGGFLFAVICPPPHNNVGKPDAE